MVRQTRWSRAASIVLACVVIATNLIALGMLVRTLTSSDTDATSLLLAGMQVWLTNVIGFGLLFWEIDRGGPVARHTLARDRLRPADWRFSQDENQDNVREVAATSSVKSNWRPAFIDYLYVSLTNSSAFSPTDTMPLTGRAKALMGLEATAALLTSLLVVARAVGGLGSGGCACRGLGFAGHGRTGRTRATFGRRHRGQEARRRGRNRLRGRRHAEPATEYSPGERCRPLRTARIDAAGRRGPTVRPEPGVLEV